MTKPRKVIEPLKRFRALSSSKERTPTADLALPTTGEKQNINRPEERIDTHSFAEGRSAF